MMPRVPEPELMDGEVQAEAYALADFAQPNQAFVDQWRRRFPDFEEGDVADLGCGPADIPIRMCRVLPKISITAIDGSAAMLEHGKRAVESAGLASRIRLLQGIFPGAPVGGNRFDAVVSNSLLHHLAEPAVLWGEIARIARRGAYVLVVDLMRPPSKEAAQKIVDQYALTDPEILRRDFFNSLCAAFTVGEIEAQLDRAGLVKHLTVEPTSDRHLSIFGRIA
jgi:ubiquinone/menaquinone biosynthesis C-methylase UbiE